MTDQQPTAIAHPGDTVIVRLPPDAGLEEFHRTSDQMYELYANSGVAIVIIGADDLLVVPGDDTHREAAILRWAADRLGAALRAGELDPVSCLREWADQVADAGSTGQLDAEEADRG